MEDTSAGTAAIITLVVTQWRQINRLYHYRMCSSERMVPAEVRGRVKSEHSNGKRAVGEMTSMIYA